MNKYVSNLVKEARNNSYLTATISTHIKNKILRSMASALVKRKTFIIKRNNYIFTFSFLT